MRVGYIGAFAALVAFTLVGCGDDEDNVTATPTRVVSATSTVTASATVAHANWNGYTDCHSPPPHRRFPA